jgi:hypothetical protein
MGGQLRENSRTREHSGSIEAGINQYFLRKMSDAMAYAEINLPYYKQGDDLDHHLSQCATVEAALEAHAQQLEAGAQMLRRVKDMVAGKAVEIDADTHMIHISGPEDVINALIDAELAWRDPFEDECDDEEDD